MQSVRNGPAYFKLGCLACVRMELGEICGEQYPIAHAGLVVVDVRPEEIAIDLHATIEKPGFDAESCTSGRLSLRNFLWR